MNFYIDIVSQTNQYGFFKKRSCTELVSICVVAENGDRYYAVNKKAAKIRVDSDVLSNLPHASSPLWKDEWQIATEIGAFLKSHDDGSEYRLYGYKPARATVLLQRILNSPDMLILSLYQDAYNFITDNSDYIRETEEFTMQPLHFVHSEIEGILKGHKRYPQLYGENDVKQVARWLRDFHIFLERIKGEMVLSSIPESNA